MSIRIRALCMLLFAILLFCFCSKKKNGIITIAGSTTMEHITQSAAEIFGDKYNITFNIQSNGSFKGVSTLLDKKCDIAESSTQISPSQLNDARKRGIKIKEFIIAQDLIIPIVHPSNPIDNLFLGQIRDIYTGLINNWEKVDGNDAAIVVIDRDQYSGTKFVWDEKIIESEKRVEGMIIAHSNSEVLGLVAKNVNSIGYISKGFLNNEVKPIMINRLKATEENVQNGLYPVVRKLYYYVDEKAFSEEARSFIIFLLSKEGKQIIKNFGFIPAHI